MIQIEKVRAGKDLEKIRKLFEEYASSLDISLNFQDFDKELASLPGDYAPPNGCLLMALWQGEIAGSVALRRLSDTVCEMKRLYTRPRLRGLGIGRALCEAIIAEARRIGYEQIRLDTIPSMERARALYRSLGFKEIDPYRYNPIEGASFMQLNLG
jgi:putative acetyltransferase